jgi:hypothetical protein
MLEFTIRQIWSVFNNAHKVIIGSDSIGIAALVVAIHLLLAVATLGLGDRTVCDIARPLRKIFKPDTDSLMDGIFEVTVAVPRAIVYYAALYIRSYVLALRVLLWLWAAAIAALFVPLAASIAMSLIYGFSTPLSQLGQVALLVPLSFWPALVYFYWRLDGKRVAKNFQAAWQC